MVVGVSTHSVLGFGLFVGARGSRLVWIGPEHEERAAIESAKRMWRVFGVRAMTAKARTSVSERLRPHLSQKGSTEHPSNDRPVSGVCDDSRMLASVAERLGIHIQLARLAFRG